MSNWTMAHPWLTFIFMNVSLLFVYIVSSHILAAKLAKYHIEELKIKQMGDLHTAEMRLREHVDKKEPSVSKST